MEVSQKEKGKENDASLSTALAPTEEDRPSLRKVKLEIGGVSKTKKKSAKPMKRTASSKKQRKVKIEALAVPRTTPNLVHSPTMKFMQSGGLPPHLTSLQNYTGIFVDTFDRYVHVCCSQVRPCNV